MRFATTRECTTVAELAERLYQLPDDERERVARRAERALLEANPHLRGLDEVPRGIVVAVPDVADTETVADTVAREAAASAPLADELEELFSTVADALAEAVDREVEDAEAASTFTRSRELRRLAEEEDDLKERLSTVREAAEERRRGADELKSYQRDVLKQLEEDLKELRAALGEGG
jgi:phage tail protein X